MRPGEDFEIRCYDYLKQTYGLNDVEFRLEGGMDSTKSDIAVIKNGRTEFYIEVKDSSAQSGQFVLIPDTETESFVFSPRNRSMPNEMTDIIISYMNKDFHRFNNAGTAGQSLDIDTHVFSKWIIEHYKSKNVEYVISYKDGFVILPIRKFDTYFDIKANYRIKKSGSGEPAKKDRLVLEREISSFYPSASLSYEDKKMFAQIQEPLNVNKFSMGKYTYYFSEKDLGFYEIKRLSNTYNMNVIFSIWMKKSQDGLDLRKFESEITH